MPDHDLPPKEILDVVVEYPQGAGGAFLSHVLACCMLNQPLIPGKNNFHHIHVKTKSEHWFAPSANTISIDDVAARFNFWIYYFKKRIALELHYYRNNQHRWIKAPYEQLDYRGDAHWLMNQCRFIIQYQTQQSFKISWIDMMRQPAAVWPTIQEFLRTNGKPNHWNLDQWLHAVSQYKLTLPGKVLINVHQLRWQIWAICLLQNHGITPDFDLIENFRTQLWSDWLNHHKSTVIHHTQKYHWVPVDQ